MNTSFKPQLVLYGSRRVIEAEIKPRLIGTSIFCLITPFTNWFIPIARKVKWFNKRMGLMRIVI